MKICVAGQGAFGQKHLDALKRIQGVEISSLIGGNPAGTEEVAKKYGVPHWGHDLAEGIKFLFDEHGRPPANAPLEDIIDERRHIEYQIKWFEAILLELRNRLIRVKEVEDYALEMLSRASPEP